MEQILYLLSTAATECFFFKPSRLHKMSLPFYTNVYKTTKFAGRSDDSKGDNHNKIADLMHFHANNN